MQTLELSGLLALLGVFGALLMFVADLVLYLPIDCRLWSTSIYFARIDPGGDALLASPMGVLGEERVMIGGVMGPAAALLYACGFLCLPVAYWQAPGMSQAFAVVAAAGLSGMMIFGGTYHALFTVTGLLAKARLQHASKGPLPALMAGHQRYMKQLYRCAAVCGLVGSLSFIVAAHLPDSPFPPWICALVPAASAPIKKLLKHFEIGAPAGLILAGGLTNLWNMLFFGAIYWSMRI